MRKIFVPAVLAGVLTLGGCGGSGGYGEAQDADIPVSYGDYYDMCNVHAGEFVQNMNIERRWTQAQHDELRKIIGNDPRCQPDDE